MMISDGIFLIASEETCNRVQKSFKYSELYRTSERYEFVGESICDYEDRIYSYLNASLELLGLM